MQTYKRKIGYMGIEITVEATKMMSDFIFSTRRCAA